MGDLNAYRERFAAVRAYEDAETRVLWRDEISRNVATKFVTKPAADAALTTLAGALGEAEANSKSYQHEWNLAVAAHRDAMAQLEKAEAELAELKARRCETCGEWMPYPVQEAFGPRIGVCKEPAREATAERPAYFACNHYERREG